MSEKMLAWLYPLAVTAFAICAMMQPVFLINTEHSALSLDELMMTIALFASAAAVAWTSFAAGEMMSGGDGILIQIWIFAGAIAHIFVLMCSFFFALVAWIAIAGGGEWLLLTWYVAVPISCLLLLDAM
ncbi:hypothetical protein SAMN04488004_107194 [Loktanella salsilacus]|uniref:Uncharacterized protein n=1 Tax=Loktanella salsilacus TaxID=195913 RepID=A0A1I4EYW6_9RHOB|nr:hypothetical protein [Loktanella salsilacus]SFL09321.1 hypothetical protein SAMN04488004_107194 [Loktanella salsilacus]